MTLDEAIKHAEEVVEKNERLCKAMPEHSANAFHCAEEHRQLAEWLKDYKRLLNIGGIPEVVISCEKNNKVKGT